jgi:hypothetical protein
LRKAANFFMAAGDRPREAAARITRLRIASQESDLEALTAMQLALEPLLPTIRKDPALHVQWLAAQGASALALRDPRGARKWLEQCIALADLKDPQQIASAFRARLSLSVLFSNSGAPLSAQEQLQAAEDMPDAGRSLPPAERAMELAEVRVGLAWSKGGASSIDALPATVARCDNEVGARHMVCGRLKVMLLDAYKVSGETAKMAPLMTDGSWWLQRSASPGTQFAAALTLARATALQPPIDPKAEALVVLEELLKPDAQRPLPVATQMPGLMTLAEIQLRLGDRSRARFWLDRAASLMDRAGGEARVATLHLKLGRALVLQSEGKDSEALEPMSELCAVPYRSAGYNLMRLNCVRSLVLTGQHSDAVNIASAAVEGFMKTIGPDAPNTQRAQKLLAALQSPAGWRPPPWDAAQIFLAF